MCCGNENFLLINKNTYSCYYGIKFILMAQHFLSYLWCIITVLATFFTVMHVTATGTGSAQDAVINSKPDVASSVLCPVLTASDLTHPPAAATASRTVTAESSLSGAFVLS
jgi:uncharacterized membrane protein YdbT with pleckstrin-like domain